MVGCYDCVAESDIAERKMMRMAESQRRLLMRHLRSRARKGRATVLFVKRLAMVGGL
jgi:hypothetical protein